VSPVKYELGFYIPEDDIRHSHCRENLKSHKPSQIQGIVVPQHTDSSLLSLKKVNMLPSISELDKNKFPFFTSILSYFLNKNL
jgi:hypothetical protein